MSFPGTDRPPRRWHHASTTLENFAVVTFRIETELLAGHVPARFEPRTFTFDDGGTGALVSVVAFVERDFAFRFAPFVRVSGALVDYRAYGSVDGEPGVYVFATSLDHPLVVVPRRLWAMPWRREPVRIEARWGGPDADRLGVSTDGVGGLSLELVGLGRPVGELDGFADAAEALSVLTHPMAGWYGDDRDLRRYSVWHDVLVPQEALLESCRVPQFADLGVDDGAADPRSVVPGPSVRSFHSAMVVEQAMFDVHTPPRRVDRRPSRADRDEPDEVGARGVP